MKPEASLPEPSFSPAPKASDLPPARGVLFASFLSRENLARALTRVERNAGAPGPDGMTTKELRSWLHVHWPEIRAHLDAGTYQPSPVRRVKIPKPGGGVRLLGVPTVLARDLATSSSSISASTLNAGKAPLTVETSICRTANSRLL